MADFRQTTTPWGARLHVVLDHTNFEVCYAAVSSRDTRFDGRFVTGVLTTGIFCRPSCPARTPLRKNVRFYPSPAAAQQSGLRACRRCRPELAPDAPGQDPTSEIAARALRLIDDGEGDHGIDHLAGRLFVSPRHLQRVLVDTYGVGPSALARMRRVRLARMLVDQTDLPLTRVAYAAGFGSVRQFNDAFKQTFHTTPSAARRSRGNTHHVPKEVEGETAATIAIPVRQPFDGRGVFEWARLHAIPSRDTFTSPPSDHAGHPPPPGTWTRVTDDWPVTLTPRSDHVEVTVDIDQVADLRGPVALARQVFDIDADVTAMAAALGTDPLLAPILGARPGVRIPGAADPYEGAIRVILGQQVSAKGATTLMARLAELTDRPGLPDPAWTATADLESLVGLTRQRAGAVRALAGAVRDGLDLSPVAPPQETADALLDLPGVGPWTVGVIRLLVLREPDAWPSGDLALRRAIEGLTGIAHSNRELDTLAERWRPWRGYAAMTLWHHYLEDQLPH